MEWNCKGSSKACSASLDFYSGYIHMHMYMNTEAVLGKLKKNIKRYIKETDGQTQEQTQTMDTDGEIQIGWWTMPYEHRQT